MTTLITSTGTQLVISNPTFEEARKIVGGCLSVICLTDYYIFICRKDYEEGMKQNILASRLLSYVKNDYLALSGDVILTDIKFLTQL